MATTIRIRFGVAFAATLVAALTAAASNHTSRPAFGIELDADEIGLMGNAGRVPDSSKPKLTAYFDHESYKPGDHAHLTITDTAASVSVRFYRAGTESEPMAIVVPLRVRSSRPRSALSAGTANTSSLAANTTGFSTRPAS